MNKDELDYISNDLSVVLEHLLLINEKSIDRGFVMELCLTAIRRILKKNKQLRTEIIEILCKTNKEYLLTWEYRLNDFIEKGELWDKKER